MTMLQKLSELMREEWDRRIRHDYRFWMSDGYASDEAMWQSGSRDMDIICAGLEDLSSKTSLEIGCGVGRLVRAASKKFKHAIGFDVSEAAIEKARELLHDVSNQTVHRGNGTDLTPVLDGSVDTVISFAALTSMPTEVIARYMRETHRVLAPDGEVRIQFYLGQEYRVKSNDTLHLRCYRREHFLAAMDAAGFVVEDISELKLPFQVSFRELGIEAVLVAMTKLDKEPASVERIAQMLLPGGDPSPESESSAEVNSELESWMSLTYAKELVSQGDMDKAREAIEFALGVQQATAIDVQDALQKLVAEHQTQKKTGITSVVELQLPMPVPGTSFPGNSSVAELNRSALQRKFPATYEKISALWGNELAGVEVKPSAEGPILYSHGMVLDHMTKPVSAARTWSQRLVAEPRIKSASEIVVVGFGSGYHLEALLTQWTLKLSVVEPDVYAFVRVLRERDLVALLERLSSLTVGDAPVPTFSDNAELVVRPQTMALFPGVADTIRTSVVGKRAFTALHPKVAVLGPLQGGTLPITAYTHRALGELKQRVREYDVSGYAQGYHQAERFVTAKNRQELLTGKYIEMVSDVILEGLTEKPIDVLICMAQAPISGKVLTELRNRGVITVLWFVEDYKRFTYWKQYASFYDYVFTIQRGGCIDALRNAGASAVHYLPTACDPFIHTPLTLSPEERSRWGSPISFVGAGYHNRQQMFASLAEYPLKLWGTEWPTCKPFDRLVQEQGRRLAPAEYVKIFNASDINLNLHSSTEKDGVDPYGDFINPRTFELASCAAFQMSDVRQLLPEAFESGKEIVTFDSAADLKDKLAYYLHKPEERRAIAARSRERALRDHTYVHRLREMVSTIYGGHFEHLQHREIQSPWNKLLERSKVHPELAMRCNDAFVRGEEPILDGLVSDIVGGKGKLSETEQKLMFLFHVRKQIIRMRQEELGEGTPK